MKAVTGVRGVKKPDDDMEPQKNKTARVNPTMNRKNKRTRTVSAGRPMKVYRMNYSVSS